MNMKKTNQITKLTDEEKDAYNGIIYCLFKEYVDEMDKQTEAERAEELETVAHFAEIEGAKANSPYAMLFLGFRAGVGKGLDFAARMEQKA